jgi:AcrR family transcriptional regulator
MSEEKHDRRSARTEEMLIHALLALIENKHYDQITVQDIVERANVGRSTFYAHYQNKDDLLLSGLGHQLDVLVQQIVLGEDDKLKFDTSLFFKHVHGHYEIYRTLIWGSGFKLLTEDVQKALSQKIEVRLKSLLSARPNISIPLPVLADSMSGVLLVLLKWWLDNRVPYSPEYMDEIFQQLMMPGIQSALEQ